MNRRSRLHFVLAIVVPAIFACVIAWLQTSNLINALVHQSEGAAYVRSEKLVQSAFDGYRRQLEGFVLDNAHWDDAAVKIHAEPDFQWIEDTWKLDAEDEDGLYDTVAFVNGRTTDIIVAYEGGKTLDLKIDDLFGQQWQSILDHLPKAADESGVVSFFSKFNSRLVVAAVAPIVAYDKSVIEPLQRPNYLIYARYVDESFLAELGAQYLVNDLQIGRGDEPGRGIVAVSDGVKLISPQFSWQTNEQAFSSKWELWRTALQSLLVTLVVLIGMTVAYWRLLLKIRENEERAMMEALRDSLTGLGNRAAFNQELSRFFAPEDVGCSVAFADLDGFKAVNDTLGHEAGDELLTKVAAMINEAAGPSGRAFRLGGDEFVVIFSDQDRQESAVQFASSLIAALGNPINMNGQQTKVGISVGVAHSGTDCHDGKTLLSRADEAMYRAKVSGRNRFVVFGEFETGAEELLQDLKSMSGKMNSSQATRSNRRFRDSTDRKQSSSRKA